MTEWTRERPPQLRVPNGPVSIRLATGDDAAAIYAIYERYVRETPITFETEPPGVDEMAARVTRTLQAHPWLVCVGDGELLGYAYGAPYRLRAAYQWSVEVTVYVRADAHRRGVGRAIYVVLLELLRLQGFYNAYAMITVPNAASVGLHESLGFTPAGVTRRVGFKLGRWHDVGTWELALRPPSLPLEPPSPLARVLGSQEWQRALANGASRFLAPERSRGDGKEEEDPDDEAPSVE
jgi:phosphinothricin acetyltransferase